MKWIEVWIWNLYCDLDLIVLKCVRVYDYEEERERKL